MPTMYSILKDHGNLFSSLPFSTFCSMCIQQYIFINILYATSCPPFSQRICRYFLLLPLQGILGKNIIRMSLSFKAYNNDVRILLNVDVMGR